MNNLYITADQVGIETGGGKVTYHESEALKSLGPCEVLGREQLPDYQIVGGLPPHYYEEPWGWDQKAYEKTYLMFGPSDLHDLLPGVTHFYAGTFSRTIDFLKTRGMKVSYTAAAHDIEVSKKEHEKLGFPYKYPHLTDPKLWERYVRGYLAADVLICPSTHSAKVMQAFGYKGRLEIISHGCDIPEKVAPFPHHFIVGYLGAVGPDKGLIYLLRAWKKLAYTDALLVLAGRDSNSDYVQQLVRDYAGSNVVLLGWVPNPSNFYNSLSCYVQPSMSEGFGIEVLEALAHGRPVICSEGAGAVDIVKEGIQEPYSVGASFPAGEVDSLADLIHWYKLHPNRLREDGKMARDHADKYTWDKVRARYVSIWRSLL